MDASSTVWIIAVVALIVGTLIGYLLGRSGGNDSRQMELIEQLDETQRELAEYKEKVTNHFEETANLVSNLTDSYKAVHTHLAKSSADLCSSELVSRKLEDAMTPKLSDESVVADAETEETEAPVSEPAAQTSETKQDESMEAPRDYAPKKPDEEGTLSETFGLKEGETADSPKDPTDFAEPKESKQEENAKSA